jgi:Ca-activated chloride channel homolog
MVHWALGSVFVLLPVPYLFRRTMGAIPPPNRVALKVPHFQQLARQTYVDSGAKRQRQWLLWTLWTIWIALLCAAARPQWLGEPTAIPLTGRDLLLAVDLSGSMETIDFSVDGFQISRLDVVKLVADDFVARRIGDRLGLIVFGSQAYLQSPLTFDRDLVRSMLADASIGLAGKQTTLGDTVVLAVQIAEQYHALHRVLVLVTDGRNTAGATSIEEAIQLARQAGLKIYTIGIGADPTATQSYLGTTKLNPSAELDEQTLGRIAKATGGKYFRARHTAGLEEVYEILDQLEPLPADIDHFRPITELYSYPLGLALAIMVVLAGVLNISVYFGRARKPRSRH